MITIKTEKGRAKCPKCSADLVCRLGGEDGMILQRNGCTHVQGYSDGYYHGEESEIDIQGDDVGEKDHVWEGALGGSF